MIELWLHDLQSIHDTEIVKNAPVVPQLSSMVETSYGTREVKQLTYDYHPTDGEVRVHVMLSVVTR